MPINKDADTVTNTYYFKAFNEDYQSGGCYHSLDNSEFRTMVILQSYADSHGYVMKPTGEGYNYSDLSSMIGVNYRTLMRSLMSLGEKGLITVEDKTNVVKLKNFVLDNLYRTSGSSKANEAKRRFAIRQQETSNKVDEIYNKQNEMEDKLNNPIVVDNDGVMLPAKRAGDIQEKGGVNNV